MMSMNQLVLRIAFCLAATLTTLAGSSTPSLSQSNETQVQTRTQSYPISELYARDEAANTAYQPLAEFLFQQKLSQSDDQIVRLYGGWRRQMARSLGLMRAAFEESGAVVRRRTPADQETRRLHLEYLSQSEKAYYAHESFEHFAEQFIGNGDISETELARLVLTVDEIREEAETEAADIWELREDTLEASQEIERKSESEEDYLALLSGNKIFNEDPELGRGEVNWIDRNKFIRALPLRKTEAFLFMAADKFTPRSFHYAKYIASQHQDSGRSRGDGQKGRDVVTCIVRKTSEGEVIDQIRVHDRHAPWSIDLEQAISGNLRDHGFVQYRQDELLYMRTEEGLRNRVKGMAWGFMMGLLQGGATWAVNKGFRTLGWVDPEETRWNVVTFAVAFSTFWGIFQPELRKFTSRVSIGWFEQNLRRIVSTGLAFNVTVTMMIHGIFHFSMFDGMGAVRFASLLAVLTASNVLFKMVMDWRMHIDSRQGTNKHRLSLKLPMFWRKKAKTAEGEASEALEDDYLEFDLGIKKSDFQQRTNSLTTFTYRFIEMENSTVTIRGVPIPIGKVIYWTLPAFELWRTLRKAHRQESDLAPQIQKTWDRWVGWWMRPLTAPIRGAAHAAVLGGRMTGRLYSWMTTADASVSITRQESADSNCKEQVSNLKDLKSK